MRKLLVSTTALSVAISPLGTMPGFAQVLNEDGSVTGPDGAVICMPTEDMACDLDAIIAQLEADAARAAAVEAEVAAAQAAADAAAAEAAAQAEAEARAQAEAEAAAAAAAAAAAEAEAQAQAQAEAEAAAAAAAAQAEAEAQARAEAEAAAARAAEEQAAAEAAIQAAAEAEAAAAAAEAAAQAAAQAEAEAAAAEAAAQAEAETAVEPVEEPIIVEPTPEEPVIEDPVLEEPVIEAPVIEEPMIEEPMIEDPVPSEEPAAEEPAEEPAAEESPAEDQAADAQVDPSTGQVIDPVAAAAALAAAQAELAITEAGEIVDPAAGLKVAEPDPDAIVEPVEAPQISEAEVESLTQILTGDPTAIDPAALAAAGLVMIDPPAEDAQGLVVPEADPAALVSAVTETITEQTARSSAQEFAAAPVALGAGKKSKFSDLEKAGLLVLGALTVGAIIRNNNAARVEEERRVVSNTGDRVVVLRPDGTYQVLKDDDTVIRRPGSTVRTETFKDGSTRTIVQRPDGTQVVTIRDATGRVLRRATYDDLGREIVLIDDLAAEEIVVIRDLPKPRKRIVISSKDQDTALKRELARIEAERAGRKFSLRQIRDIPEVRALAATIDVTPVTFATGSAAVAPAQARNLADLGRIMQDLLAENPREVFLIEGHTDATGKAAMNLALSDRRAESVALALTEYFDIPPENMVVQGYGETELLIDTQANEPRNRRVEVRVITPLLRTAQLR